MKTKYKTDEEVVDEVTARMVAFEEMTPEDEKSLERANIILSTILQIREADRKAIVQMIANIEDWPEPKEGAGEGLGPLAGVGMYHQYDADRSKHKQQLERLKTTLLGIINKHEKEESKTQ